MTGEGNGRDDEETHSQGRHPELRLPPVDLVDIMSNEWASPLYAK